MNRRQLLRGAGVAASTATTVGLSGCSLLGGEPVPETQFVAPEGDDGARGTEDDPLATIQRGVERAGPGDTVRVRPGEYHEVLDFRTDGEPDAPITLSGPSDAVLKPPDGDSAAVHVGASHVHLRGLTITGLLDPSAPLEPASYTSAKLIDLNTFAEGDDDYLEGLVVSPDRIGNAGGSLINSVRIRDCDIGGFEVIGPTGTEWILDDAEGHYGEVVYLGTAPDNVLERDEFEEYDRTRNVRVHHVDNSAGHLHSELVDCKAGTENVTIEYCTDGGGARNDEGGVQPSIHMQGHDCTVRWNHVHDPQGPAVMVTRTLLRENGDDRRYGAPETNLEHRIGTANEIYGNAFSECGAPAILFPHTGERFPVDVEDPVDPAAQRRVCGNAVDGVSHASPDRPCRDGVPDSGGIGHLAGDSPWEESAPDHSAALGGAGVADVRVDATLETETVAVGEPIEVTATVRNERTAIAVADLEVTVAGATAVDGRRTLAPGADETVGLETGPAPQAGSFEVTLQGDALGTVTVEEPEGG